MRKNALLILFAMLFSIGQSQSQVRTVVTSNSPLITNSLKNQGSWSSTYTYSANDVVLYNGGTYVSSQNSNTNNTPSSTSSWWSILFGSITSVNGQVGPLVNLTYSNVGADISGAASQAQSNAEAFSANANNLSSGQVGCSLLPTMTGDVSNSNACVMTLATVNTNVGSFGSSTAIPSFTVNAKGLITLAGSSAVIAPAGTLTGTTLASNVVTSSLTSAAGGSFGTFAYISSLSANSLAGSVLANNIVNSSLMSAAGGNFGTFAFQSYATPPVIGATTPNAIFSSTLSASTSFTLNGSQAIASIYSLTGTEFLAATGTITNGDLLQMSNDGNHNIIDTGILSTNVCQTSGAQCPTTIANITGGALGSILYQSAPSTTSLISGPMTSGHIFAVVEEPTGSTVSPQFLDVSTLGITINGVLCDLTSTCSLAYNANALSGTTLSSSVVTSSLTGVGTLTAGTWNASNIAVGFGGTGTGTAPTTGQFLIAQTASAYAPESISGDFTISTSGVGTLTSVNPDIGLFGSASLIPTISVNAKGLITAVTTNALVAPAGTLTGTTIASNVVASSLTSFGASPTINQPTENQPVTFHHYTAVASAYTVSASDYQIEATSGTFTVTLPTAVGITGRVYSIKNSGTGTITVATTSSQTIDGQTTQPLNQYANIIVFSNGTNWIIQ
jgi:hypothetical protein